jgi:hypothetical protein
MKPSHDDIAPFSTAPLSQELADSVAYCLLVDPEHGDLDHRCFDCGTTWKEPHLPICQVAEGLKDRPAWVSRGARLRLRAIVHGPVHNP